MANNGNVIKNIELKILAILQGSSSENERMAIRDLADKVYGWDSYIQKGGRTDVPFADKVDEVVTVNGSKKDKNYNQPRIVARSICNILSSYKKEFPVSVYGPLAIYSESEGKRKRSAYLDERYEITSNPVYVKKKIFTSISKRDDEIERETKDESDEAKKERIANCICNCSIVLDGNTSLSKYPDVREWEVCYNQPFSSEQSYLILSGVLNQRDFDKSEIEELIERLAKVTSDSKFKQFVDKYALESYLSPTEDEKNSGQHYVTRSSISTEVMRNIGEIMRAINEGKKITFSRIYYACDYKTKKWSRKEPTPGEYKRIHNGASQDYTCTPFNIFMHDGRCWLLALKDSYNTPQGNFMPCPLDLIVDLKVLEEKGVTCEDIQFLDNGEGNIKEERLLNYAKTNYEKPEVFHIKVKRNQTSGTLILRTFGDDFAFVESNDSYDLIKVFRSPYFMINWALTNTRDVEVIPQEASTKKRLQNKVKEIAGIYAIRD